MKGFSPCTPAWQHSTISCVNVVPLTHPFGCSNRPSTLNPNLWPHPSMISRFLLLLYEARLTINSPLLLLRSTWSLSLLYRRCEPALQLQRQQLLSLPQVSQPSHGSTPGSPAEPVPEILQEQHKINCIKGEDKTHTYLLWPVNFGDIHSEQQKEILHLFRHSVVYVAMSPSYSIPLIDALHVHGNAANLEDRIIFFYMRIDRNSQKRKFLLFCPPDWLHSHDVQRDLLVPFVVVFDWHCLK